MLNNNFKMHTCILQLKFIIDVIKLYAYINLMQFGTKYRMSNTHFRNVYKIW